MGSDSLIDGYQSSLTPLNGTTEAKAEHEEMGFHEGWGKAAEQLEALAKSL
jgi:uncharacterized protein YndB with AHSA1/START domain